MSNAEGNQSQPFSRAVSNPGKHFSSALKHRAVNAPFPLTPGTGGSTISRGGGDEAWGASIVLNRGFYNGLSNG